jgi:hypothetical protein
MLNVKNSVVFLPSIVLGFGAAFLFLVFHFRKVLSTKRGVIFAILLLVAAAMTSLSFFKDVSTIDISAGSKVLNLSGFASSNFILLSAPLILLLILSVVYVVKERRRYDKKYLFVLLWFLIMMIIIFSPREITRLFPDKIVQIIYAPVMVIAAKGLLEFSARYHISTKTLFLAVLVISVPGIIIWLGSVQLQPRIYSNLSGIAFYTHDEYESVKFLENQELGTVLAPKEIAINIPQMSGKKALLIIPEWSGITYNFNNKTADYATFYSGTDDQRLAIVHKYNITYVFAETDDFENSTIMKSIYEAGKVKLYKIN